MFPRISLSCFSFAKLSMLAIFAVALGFAASNAYCQKQEKGTEHQLDTRSFREKMENPADRTLTSPFASKEFSPRGSVNTQKSANSLRAFPFTKSAYSKDFRSKDFAGAKGFRSKDYTGVKSAATGNQTFTQTDKAYGTREFAVRDDRQANKAFGTREYGEVGKIGVMQGKSQDTFDAILAQKNLSIDQVRELLNKNK